MNTLRLYNTRVHSAFLPPPACQSYIGIGCVDGCALHGVVFTLCVSVMHATLGRVFDSQPSYNNSLALKRALDDRAQLVDILTYHVVAGTY